MKTTLVATIIALLIVLIVVPAAQAQKVTFSKADFAAASATLQAVDSTDSVTAGLLYAQNVYTTFKVMNWVKANFATLPAKGSKNVYLAREMKKLTADSAVVARKISDLSEAGMDQLNGEMNQLAVLSENQKQIATIKKDVDSLSQRTGDLILVVSGKDADIPSQLRDDANGRLTKYLEQVFGNATTETKGGKKSND